MNPQGLARWINVIFPPLFDGTRRIGFLAASYYGDRSSVEFPRGKDRVFAVAGAISADKLWTDTFAPKWNAALVREGIESFHMTEFETYNGHPYKDWTRAKHDAFSRELVEIIHQTQLVPSAVALDLEAYGSLSDAERDRMGHPYRFCACLCIALIADFLRKHEIDAPAAYIFDQGDDGFYEFKETVIPHRKRLLVGLLMDAPNEDFIQLQAADFLAHEAAKSGLREIGVESRPHRGSLLATMNSFPPFYTRLFDGPRIRAWLDKGCDTFDWNDDNPRMLFPGYRE
jgi:hypothetical protein